MRILVVEDDDDTAEYIRTGLEEAGHAVERAKDGSEGLLTAMAESFDVMIIDRLLPNSDGLTVVKMLRAGGIKAPILFLSTLGGIEDRVTGLEAGGDDYLVKPFAFSELQARVNALGRRPALVAVPSKLTVGDLEMDLGRRSVTRGGREIDLQPREFRLLEYMMRNVDRVVTRTMLLEQVWDFHFDPMTSVVETHISRLRRKIDKGQTNVLDSDSPRRGLLLTCASLRL
jgi:two-component system, OmpR family, response regulator